MSLRQTLLRHRKDQRLIVGGLAALLLLSTAVFYRFLRGRNLPEFLVTNRVLLFVVWYVNVVLILIVLFVLLRNLFKLLIERRHRVLGSTFKLKLVATYIGLSLIPALALFAIAAELLQGSIDRWFSTPLRPVLERGSGVALALYDRLEQHNLRDAQRVLHEVSQFDLRRAEERPRFNRRLEALLTETRLGSLAVYEGTDFVGGVLDPKSGLRELPEPPRFLIEEAGAEGEARLVESTAAGRDKLIYAAAGERRAGPAAPGVKPTVVVAASLLGPALAARTASLIQVAQDFRQLDVQKDDLRASHLLIFLMMTLVILLGSSWVGLHLAQRVAVPIQALADGMRRISVGDLHHRVDVQADDELGVLVDSFNRMAKELADSKELLERSNRELTLSNERVAAERALIEAVLQSVAAGVVSIDSEGRILTCNEAALRLLRQREEEVVERLVEEAWADPERCKLAAVLAEPWTEMSKELHLALDGEWKSFEAKVSALKGAAGTPHGRVLVLENLTELIKAQQVAAWTEAARRIAHEIKNPLTPIRLAAERMLKKHRQGDADLGQAIENGSEIIVREVTTLQRMVDEFSRYARMPRPQPSRVDLSQLLAEILHLYQGVKPGVEVEAQLAGDVASVVLDAEQIKRVLINLLDNAVEATDAPGRVTVTAQKRDGHLAIQVADTGRGIPHDAKEKLFLPYFSTKGRGTGLGLAIVHRIVADHHGSIRVADNQPRGAVFTVKLPAQ